jgi:serine/threonine-protein kinase
MQVTLRVVSGPQQGRVFTFNQHDTFLIGRSESAQFCLPEDRFFSRNHCLLEIAPPQCFLRDLNSTNGTFVNGQRVESSYLKSGDTIQGGETVLAVEVTAELGSPSQKLVQKTVPSVVTVTCLNCGLMKEAEASAPDSRMSFVCDDCRDKLKQKSATYSRL